MSELVQIALLTNPGLGREILGNCSARPGLEFMTKEIGPPTPEEARSLGFDPATQELVWFGVKVFGMLLWDVGCGLLASVIYDAFKRPEYSSHDVVLRSADGRELRLAGGAVVDHGVLEAFLRGSVVAE